MTIRKPNLSELLELLVILSLCATILYLYYADEPKNVSPNIQGMDFGSDLIYATFPRNDLNQTTIIINSSYILNMTKENDTITIIVRNN